MLKDIFVLQRRKKTTFQDIDATINTKLSSIFKTLVASDYPLKMDDRSNPYLSRLAAEIYDKTAGLSRNNQQILYTNVQQTGRIKQSEDEIQFSEDEVFLNAALLKTIESVAGEDAVSLIRNGDVETVKANFPAHSMVIVFTELIFNSDMKYVHAYSALKILLEEIAAVVDQDPPREKNKNSTAAA